MRTPGKGSPVLQDGEEVTLPVNARSARVAERAGAVKEGTITLRGLVADWWVHRRPGAGVVV